jgi:hypothetical protein
MSSEKQTLEARRTLFEQAIYFYQCGATDMNACGMKHGHVFFTQGVTKGHVFLLIVLSLATTRHGYHPCEFPQSATSSR